MKRDLTWATALILVLPGPRARADDPPPVAITYDKGFKLTSGDARFVLKTAVRSQFRLEGARPAAGGETLARFYIPRLRLQLEGQAFGPALTYKLELGASEKGATMVKDAYLDDHVGAVHLRAGQFKRPFNRQELVSDFAGVFNERSLASEHVGGGRDAGVMVHNGFEHSPRGIEWALGLFDSANGGKDRPLQTTTCKADAAGTLTCTTSAPSNVMGDFGPAVVARAGWNFGKLKGYSEADLEGGPVRAGIGVNYKVDLADFDDAAMVQALGIDFVLKVRGLDLGAGGFLTIGARSSAGDRPRGAAAYLQAGALVTRTVHLAARFATAPAAGKLDQREIEARGAVNKFFQGHTWKLASDLGVVGDPGERAALRVEVRSMAQLTF